MMVLFSTVAINVLVTIAVTLLVIGSFLLINRFINKKSETLGKIPIILLYVFLLIIFLGALFFSFYTWNFDFATFITNFWNDAADFVLSEIGDLVWTVVVIFASSFLLKIFKIIMIKGANKVGPNQKRRQTMFKVTNSLVNYTVKLLALLLILSIWGVDVLPALAGLGILGLVIGLGAQSLIKDFIAGFFIIFEHHFDVGDVVEINGFKGTVVDIGLKSTRIKNWKQDIKIFSNGSISDSINYSSAPSTAVIDFGIGYGENIQKTIDLLNQELPKYRELLPNILEDPVVVGVVELADSSVNLRVVVKTATEQHYGIERALRQGIKEILDKNGIEIPFPQRVIHTLNKD